MSSTDALQRSAPKLPIVTGAVAAERPATDPRALDFEQLVGREGWWRLAPDIRRRFTEKPKPGVPIHFIGTMHQVECSWSGWALAQCCKLIGTPFAPYRGTDVPVTIALRDEAGGGVVWEREYRYPNRPAAVVSSLKRIDANGSLLECVGFGLGMRLAVFEANRALHFLSLHYFFHIGRTRFRLPRLLSPGTAHVIHTDLGHGHFRFTMTIHHRLFGTLFQQDGVFHRQGAGQ